MVCQQPQTSLNNSEKFYLKFHWSRSWYSKETRQRDQWVTRKLAKGSCCYYPVSKRRGGYILTKAWVLHPSYRSSSWLTWTLCKNRESCTKCVCQRTQRSPALMLPKLKFLWNQTESLWTTTESVLTFNTPRKERQTIQLSPARKDAKLIPQIPKPDTSPPFVLLLPTLPGLEKRPETSWTKSYGWRP